MGGFREMHVVVVVVLSRCACAADRSSRSALSGYHSENRFHHLSRIFMLGQQADLAARLANISDPRIRQAIMQAMAKKGMGNQQSQQQTLQQPAKQPASISFKAEQFKALMKKAEEHRVAQRLEAAADALKRASTLQPDDPRPYFHLAMVLTTLEDIRGACVAALKAVKHAPGEHLGVLPSEDVATRPSVPRGIYPQIGLRAAVMAFDLLIRSPCDGLPRPSWWNDEALLAVSERAMTDTPHSPYTQSLRSHVLLGVMSVGSEQTHGVISPRGWELGARSAAQLREAAGLLKKQAMLEPAGSPKAVQALANAAAIFEAAMRMEADEALFAQPGAYGQLSGSRLATGSARSGSAHAASAHAASAHAAPPPSLIFAKSPPASPTRPSSSPAASPSKRTEALSKKKAVIEEQLAALERQLAAVRGPLELS